jgi:hypothetical protein
LRKFTAVRSLLLGLQAEGEERTTIHLEVAIGHQCAKAETAVDDRWFQ